MIKISCVSYLNSQPFIYGLQNSAVSSEIELSLDIPSVCAEKLKSGAADIGLIPVVVIPELNEAHRVSDYCIGAEGKVETVKLYSKVPLEQIESIQLDSQSRTSVILARILAEKFWKIQPRWVEDGMSPEKQDSLTTAHVLIGDKTFEWRGKYPFEFDLSEEWEKFTALKNGNEGLPFVFACWVANRNLPAGFLKRFNEALHFGLSRRNEMIPALAIAYPHVDVNDYLQNKISYIMDKKKRQAMNLFLEYAGTFITHRKGA